MTVWPFLLVAFASWRVAVLLTMDEITDGLRARLLRRFPPRTVPLVDTAGQPMEGTATLRARWPVALFSCPSCVGLWTAGAGMLTAHAAGVVDRWATVGFGWGAAAGVGVLLSDVSERLSR